MNKYDSFTYEIIEDHFISKGIIIRFKLFTFWNLNVFLANI
ncbi:hypothetical protein Pf1_02143 [Flavobacterium columnare]|nr:hypothetical protein [Flavobacterium columnare]ANO47598.1 hypothetical protein Pf1_02143 [Flavobacterium columnare]